MPLPAPVVHPVAVKAFFRQQFASQPQAYWIDWFEDVDAAFAPVRNLREAMDDPQLRFREMIVEDVRGNEHIGIPVKFLKEPGQVNFAAPVLGEHNRELVADLGYSDTQIDDMVSDGVFG